MRVVLLSIAFLIALTSTSAAQWHLVKDLPNHEPSIVYFPPFGDRLLGFVATRDGNALPPLWRTNDGGTTWQPISGGFQYEQITDILFKDSVEGWLANWRSPTSPGGCYHTTDAGLSWTFVSGSGDLSNESSALYYNQTTNTLIVGDWINSDHISSDGGKTWSTFSYSTASNGFAFVDKQIGIQTATTLGGYPNLPMWPFQRTTNGGLSWITLSMVEESWQPLAVPSQNSFYAMSDQTGTFYRSSDAGLTWSTVNHFNPRHEPNTLLGAGGSVFGNECQLFVQMPEGMYRSTDAGSTWTNLGGPISTELYDNRFWTDGHRLFETAQVNEDGQVWELNLDSLVSTDINASLSVAGNSSDSSWNSGDTARVTFSLTRTGAVSLDTVLVHIRYTAPNFRFLDVHTFGQWKLLSETNTASEVILSFVPGVSDTSTTVAELDFATDSTGSHTAWVRADGMRFTGFHSAGCAMSALVAPDSAKIIFKGCPDGPSESVAFHSSITPPHATAGTPVTLRITPDNSISNAGLDTVSLSISYYRDLFDVGSITSSSGIATLGAPIQNGSIATIPITIVGTDLTLDPSTALLNLTLLTRLSDSLHTKIDLSNLAVNPSNPQYVTCILGASIDSTEFHLDLRCGDSTLRSVIEGKPLFTVESIVPNPARDEIRVRFAGAPAEVRAELFDVLGSKSLEVADVRGTSLHVGELPSGTYYLRLSSGGYVVTRRVVIER